MKKTTSFKYLEEDKYSKIKLQEMVHLEENKGNSMASNLCGGIEDGKLLNT